MVTRPDSLKVGAKTYRVHWSKKAWKNRLLSTYEGTKRDKENEPSGVTHHITSQIWINPEQDAQEARATLVHELLHCCFWDSGQQVNDLYEHDPAADPDTEERVIMVLEPRLTSLLVDNPELLDYLSPQPSQEARLDPMRKMPG